MFDNVLSEFDCPSESPLYEDGAWGGPVNGFNQMQKVCDTPPNGHATDTVHGSTNYSVWLRDVFNSEGGPIEAFACTEGGQLGAALETWRVALWTDYAAQTGYLVYFGGGIGKGTVIRRYNAGVFIDIASAGFDGYPQMLGIRINGPDIEAWGMNGGVWTMKTSVPDTNYRGTFWASIGIEDPTGGGLSMSCFGAGKRNRTQIYRWIRADS